MNKVQCAEAALFRLGKRIAERYRRENCFQTKGEEYMKRAFGLILAGLLLICFTACQPTFEEEVVTYRDAEALEEKINTPPAHKRKRLHKGAKTQSLYTSCSPQKGQ